jgi:uncharacterized membrane protein (UPF0127 family)
VTLRATGVLAAAWLAATALCAAPAAAACRDDVVDLRGPGGMARFTVEIADEPEERARGLMFREDMPDSHGMLFVFDPVQPVSFWMRNTPMSLDLLFVNADGTVRRVTEDAVPFSEETMPSGGPVRAVLEIKAGMAERYGLEEGTEMRHPAFGPEAAWPCE